MGLIDKGNVNFLLWVRPLPVLLLSLRWPPDRPLIDKRRWLKNNLVELLLEVQLARNLVVHVFLLFVINEQKRIRAQIGIHAMFACSIQPIVFKIAHQLIEQMAYQDGFACSSSALHKNEFSKLRITATCHGASLGNSAQDLFFRLTLFLRKTMERRGFEERGVLDKCLRRKQLGVKDMERSPRLAENRVKLTAGVVVTLRIRATIIQARHGVDAQEILHHPVLDVERQRLVKVRVPDDVLNDRRMVMLRPLAESPPVIARRWVGLHMLACTSRDIVCLPNVRHVLVSPSVRTGPFRRNDIYSWKAKDVVICLIRFVWMRLSKLALAEFPVFVADNQRRGNGRIRHLRTPILRGRF